MATFSMSTVAKGSEEFKDFCCSICSVEVVADSYCESCLKFYCRKCVRLHGQLFKKHSTYGKWEMKMWPVSKKVMDFLQKCEVHTDERIEMFCVDHNQLCCTHCAFLNHRQCIQVKLICESVPKQPTDLQQISAQIQSILKQLKGLQTDLEASIQSMQVSYDEHERYMLKEMHQNINSLFDEFEHSTNENEQYDNEEIGRKINLNLHEFESNLKEMKDEHVSLKDSIHNCTRLQDDLKQLHEAMQKIGDDKELSFIASKKCLHKIQQALTVLGKSVLHCEGEIRV